MMSAPGAQEKIRKYIQDNMSDIRGRAEGAGDKAVEYALLVTRQAMEDAGMHPNAIKAQAPELSSSMLYFELFDNFTKEK